MPIITNELYNYSKQFIKEIDNCLFKSNSAVGYGGAITNEGFLKVNNSI